MLLLRPVVMAYWSKMPVGNDPGVSASDKAADLFLRALEYHIPKISRTELERFVGHVPQPIALPIPKLKALAEAAAASNSHLGPGVLDFVVFGVCSGIVVKGWVDGPESDLLPICRGPHEPSSKLSRQHPEDKP